MTQGPYQIFISYAHTDLDGRQVSAGEIDSFVDKVIDQGATDKFQLELTSFLDQNDMRGDWLEFIRENLHESTIFMPILTPKYFMREMCINELATFVAQALESKAIKCIIPIEWDSISDEDIKRHDFNVDAYNYLTRYQVFDATSDKKRDKIALAFNCAKDIFRNIEDGEKKHRRSSVVKRLPESLDAYVLSDSDEVLAKQEASRININDAQASEPVHAELNAAQTESPIVANKPAALPVPSDEESQAVKIRKKGSQNHKGYAPAHELMVKIYNTVAETPFVEGSKDRSSVLKPEFRVPGVLETVSLTKDGAHLTQGMNFNLDSNLAPVYISANWQGVPNDGSGRDYERGKRELGRFAILPSIHRLESYEPWEQDFGNTLANYLYRIKMAEPYAQEYLRHKDEWQERLVRFAGSPDVKNSLKNELFAWGRFHSANSRLEFVRDGKLLPVWEIDNDLLNRTVIDITDPTEVDEILELLDGIGKSGVRYFRTGAPLDTDKDYTKFLDALHAYRAFLE